MSSPYQDLRERSAKIDRRRTVYRFDLATDIAWSRCDEPGLYYGPRLLAALGVDVATLSTHPGAMADFQWSMALSTCLEFIELERGILEFVAQEHDVLGPVRSTTLLVEEEAKHIELFLLYAERLRRARPELVAPLERLFHGLRGAPFDAPERYPDAASRHYAFWLSTLFFEDYTIWLHERLAQEASVVQPAWLTAHAMHRREEEQHVVTDLVHVEAVRLDDDERRRWSRLSHVWLADNVRRFIGLDAPDALVRELYPQLGMATLARFADTALHRDLLAHSLFRRTRKASPYLQALAAGGPVVPVPGAASASASPTSRREGVRGRLRALRTAAEQKLTALGERVKQMADTAPVERFDLRRAKSVAGGVASVADRAAAAVATPEAAAGAPHIDAIRAVWAQVLDVPAERIGDDDDFASLGGDSLQAVEIMTGVEALLGRALGPDILLECRTVRDFAEFLRRDGAPAAGPTRAAAAVSRPRERVPVAIVGVAARLPGAADLDAFWTMIEAGADAFREVPAERWSAARYHHPDPRAPGKTVCVRGAFLDDIDRADPAALGLSDAEARQMDPQKRLLLELAGDLLESAGPSRGRVGVFASAGMNEYFAELRRDLTLLGGHAAVGNLDNMIAARIAQSFGLRGPALSVNAACASSHVAIHLACRSIQAGECDMAIAGASQINLGPMAFVAFSQAGVLSASQRCRPFSDAADGFVPGEGAGAVLLKPLDAALADGDDVLAVIRGSAMNNDGRALSGMAPSPVGQVEVLRAAYADAGLDPATVSYLETHGTGTSIGDAVEVQALSQVFRGAVLGSVKANIGHTLTCAGVASVIKVVLAMRHGVLPPIAGLERPNPRIAFDRFALEPAASARRWTVPGGGSRRAGVTGLGIGGTNCHLVMEEPPPRSRRRVERDMTLVCVAAPSPQELERVAAEYARRIEADPAVVAGINARAHRFDVRASVVAAPGDVAAALRGHGPTCKAREDARVALVFSGPGSQYAGMARPLYRDEPVFRDAIDRAARALAGLLPRPLTDYLYGDATADIDRIEVTQSVVFAVGQALWTWLEHLGVRPHAVLGHSAGEYVAAYAAGGLDLETAVTLVAGRGQAMSRTREGRMAAVFAGEAAVRGALGDLGDALDLAAVNAPDQVVLSGDGEALARALARLEATGIGHHLLPISCAAHSPLMAPALPELAGLAGGATFTPLAVPLYSTVHGRRVEPGTVLGAEHWVEHLRAPVRFADAVAAVAADGVDLFLEVGASGGLVPCIRAVLEERSNHAAVVPLMRRALADSWQAPLEAIGRLVEVGVPVDLRRLDGHDALADDRYPYARRRLWLLPGEQSPAPGRPLAASEESYIRDHVAAGHAIAPGALLMALTLENGDGALPVVLHDLVNARPLEGAARRVHVSETDGRITVSSTSPAGGDAVVHFTARRGAAVRGASAARIDLAAIRARCPADMDRTALYDLLAASGLRYGPTMDTVSALRAGDGELLASLEARDDDTHRLHPAVVDGAMQAIGGFGVRDRAAGRSPGLFLGFSVGTLTVVRPVPRRALAHVVLVSPMRSDAETIRARVTIVDEDGEVCAAFDDVGLKRVRQASSPPAQRRMDTVLLLRRDAAAARPVRRELEDRGVFVIEAAPPSTDAEAAELIARSGPVDAVQAVDVEVPGALRGLSRPTTQLPGTRTGPPAPRVDAPAPGGAIGAFLVEQLSGALRVPPSSIDPRTRFNHMGVDSLMAVDMVLRLERRFGLRLFPTLLFEHQTIEAVEAALQSMATP